MYKPLPDSITIKKSGIEGLGLFATENIPANIIIGKIHVPNEKEENGYFRTPLGGFGNHSDDPNCFKLLMDPVTFWIGALKNIKAWEELTWTYTLYNIPRKKRNANIRI